jgi:hypothetical protein
MEGGRTRPGSAQEFFFHGVLAEPGDGAQPPGDGGAGKAPSFEFSGQAFDVGAADGEQATEPARHQVVNWRRSRAQAARVRLRYPGQEPGEGKPFSVSEGGLDRGERAGWGGSGQRAPPGPGWNRADWASSDTSC